jgi:prepilin-type N-terminal cleavage/methylation domain-containing protein
MKKKYYLKTATVPVREKQTGFTIIELMISTVVFTLVLMMVTAGIVQISRMYYQGIISARTQDTARSIVEEISQSIQFSNQSVVFPQLHPDTEPGPVVEAGENDTFWFCIGTKRYTYAIDRQRSATPSSESVDKEKLHVLWTDEPVGGCAEASVPPGPANLSDPNLANGTELIDQNMRINKLVITSQNGENWNITLSIASGEEFDFELNASGMRVCKGGAVSAQFCAVSELTTSVAKRI